MTIDDKVSMFYGADALTFKKAELLRQNTTLEENLLWTILNDRTRFKYKFRRQHPINIYIVDFYCHSLKLIIEIDGGYHMTENQQKYDLERERDLQLFGLKVIRFKNTEITGNIEKVISEIKHEISVLTLAANEGE
jgi:very-short-patch-repair endonuclease